MNNQTSCHRASCHQTSCHQTSCHRASCLTTTTTGCLNVTSANSVCSVSNQTNNFRHNPNYILNIVDYKLI